MEVTLPALQARPIMDPVPTDVALNVFLGEILCGGHVVVVEATIVARIWETVGMSRLGPPVVSSAECMIFFHSLNSAAALKA